MQEQRCSLNTSEIGRILMDQNPACVVITDTEGRIEYVNPKFIELTGYLLSEVQGRIPHILNAGLEPVRGSGDLWPTIRAGRNWDGTFCNRKKNGEIYWESARIAPVRGAKSEITHFIAVKEDISARILAERRIAEQNQLISAQNEEYQTINETLRETIEQLERSQTRFRKAMEGIHSYIYFTEYVEGDPVFHYHSPGCLQISGYSADELQNNRELWFSMIHPDDRELVQAYVADVHSGKTTAGAEYRITHKDGHIVWIMNHYSAEKDAVGRLQRVQGFIIDMTDRIALEHDLLEAKLSADRANRAKSDFLASMSHELRTPLNSVLGFSQLLVQNREKNLNQEQLNYLVNINSSGSHLLAMINDILDLSKIEAGKIDLNKRPFNLRPLLQALIASFQAQASEKNIRLQLRIADTIGSIVADETKVRQILFNLLSNAIKFTGRGKSVGLDASAQNGLLCLLVWDEGIGIAEEDSRRVFNPFEQVRANNQKNKGTGLGLAITEQLVELHGGRIQLESQLGQGSRFTIYLPGHSSTLLEEQPAGNTASRYSAGQSETAAFQQSAAVGGTAAAAAESVSHPATGSDRQILVVEDNEINQQLIAALLQSLSCSCTIAGSGEQAWDLMYANSYDVVLMDINLPGIDGIETTRRYRRYEALLPRKNPETCLPIIALTAHALHNDHERFLANGLTDVLTKPIEIDKLKQCLQRYLPGVQLHSIAPQRLPVDAKELNMSDKNETDAFDIEKLAEVLNLPFEFLTELIKTFFDDIWLVYRDDLAAAIKSGDYAEIKNKAHKIKGAVANLRFTKAAEILGSMEKLAAQEAAADYLSMFEQVKVMIAKMEQEITGKSGT